MFARIPGLKNNLTDVESLSNLPGAPVVALGFSPLHLRPSANLWRIQLATHFLAGLLLFWALLPWLFIHFAWFALLCVGWCGLVASAFYLAHKRRESAGILSLTETGWRWHSSSADIELVLRGELVVWQGLIILPFREKLRRRRRFLVLLSDSGAAEDIRRLRVWLRTVVPRR